MKRLEFGETDKLVDVLQAIQHEAEREIEIFVFPGSEILQTKANKEIINHLATALGKKIIIRGKEEPVITPVKKEEEDFGFFEGKDVAKETPPSEKPFLKEKKRFPLPKIAFPKGPKWLYAIIGFIIILLATGLSVFWWLPSATVTLYTQSQFKEAELSLIASKSASSPDAEKEMIPLKIYEVEEEDTLDTKATGEKTVGTPAKGRVKIVNRDTEPKTFFAGAILTPTSGPQIKFTLDQVATVSAKPGGCVDDCPEVSADVTAQQIGEEGNLPVNTVFRVGTAEIPDVIAQSLTNFTGGTKKTVKVVSADDQKKAKEELLKKLEGKAIEELKKKQKNITIPEGGIENKVVDEIYDKKIEEEAESFRTSLEVIFTIKAFSEDDLKDLLIKSISPSLPFGFEVSREESVVTSEVLEKTDEDLKILGKIKAVLIPLVDTEEVKRNITGKNFAATDSYLKGLESISSFEVKVSPAFFRFFQTMPHLGSRIKIEIVQQKE